MLAAITKRPHVMRDKGFCENGSMNRGSAKASPAETMPGRARVSTTSRGLLSPRRPRLVRFLFSITRLGRPQGGLGATRALVVLSGSDRTARGVALATSRRSHRLVCWSRFSHRPRRAREDVARGSQTRTLRCVPAQGPLLPTQPRAEQSFDPWLGAS